MINFGEKSLFLVILNVVVDDIGTIHVDWDCGSGLGIAYGEDVCKKVVEE